MPISPYKVRSSAVSTAVSSPHQFGQKQDSQPLRLGVGNCMCTLGVFLIYKTPFSFMYSVKSSIR